MRIYAVLVDRHESALEKVISQGTVVSYTRLNNHGEEVETEKKNLHLAVAQECERQLVAILDRLGLSPRARDYVRPTAPRKRKPATIPGSVAWQLEQDAAQETEQETPQATVQDFSDMEDIEI